MAGLIRQPWRRQPPTPTGVDWSNPITRGLVFCAVPVGGTYLDLVTGVLGTPQGTTLAQNVKASGFAGPTRGVAVSSGPGSTDAVYWPVSTLRGGSIVNTGTLLCLGGSDVQNDGVAYPVGGNTDAISSGEGFGLQIDSFQFSGRGNVIRSKYSTAAASSTGQLLGNPFNSKLHFFGYSFNGNGANGTYFGDGTTEAWSGSAAVHGTTTTNRQACVLAQSTNPLSGTPHNGFASLFLMWERELSAGDYLSLHANPWQLFAPLSRRIWTGAASTISGTTTSTLADATLVATGAVALAGSTTATLANATLAATGAVALAGSTASTLADATIAATGAVAIAGTTTATLDDATLIADGGSSTAGALAVTLADATLAATGAVALVGSASITLDDCTIVAAGHDPNAGGASAEAIWSFVMTDGRTAAEVLMDTNAKVDELWREHGLDITAPLRVTSTTRVAGTQTQTIVEAGGLVTVQRT